MDKLKDFLVNNQKNLALAIGYILVAALAFGIGRFSQTTLSAAPIRVEQAFTSPTNYTPETSGVQTISTIPATTSATTATNDCNGKIKGTSSKIYHLPGDPFYARTTKPVACFDTEAQAQAAGFKPSGK